MKSVCFIKKILRLRYWKFVIILIKHLLTKYLERKKEEDEFPVPLLLHLVGFPAPLCFHKLALEEQLTIAAKNN